MRKKVATAIITSSIAFLTKFHSVFAQNVDTPRSGQGGLDLWWLLPLLAIPVLFFVFRDKPFSGHKEHDHLTGNKGGRSRHDHDRRTEFGEDDDEE